MKNIELWKAYEITFSAKIQVNDFDDTEVDVIFTHNETSESLTIPAFWDGGFVWRVRFTPTKLGAWSYNVKEVKGIALGIDGISDEVNAVPYEGDLEIYKRGFIKTIPDVRYFVYDDGTPFFYLGDTHWTMPKEEFDSAGPNAGDIKTDSHFKYIVDKRVEQGFTVYQSEPLQAAINVSEGIITEKYVGAYQNLDRYYKYIAEKGLVHVNAQFFLPGIRSLTEKFLAKMREFTRYWVARYSAYPVMWTLGQEVDGARSVAQDVPIWQHYVNMCEIMSELDPYKHPISAHQINARDVTALGGVRTAPIDWGTGEDRHGVEKTMTSSKSKFYGAVGHTWWASQWRPIIHRQHNSDIPRDYWENGEGKPTVDYEPRYHFLGGGDFCMRAQAWISYLSGMCGHGYGAEDMWYYINTYATDHDSFDGIENVTSEKKKTVLWSELIHAPITNELGYLKKFLEDVCWWKLIPDFDCGNAFKKVEGKEGLYACAYIKNDLYIVYLYNRSVDSAGKLVNMDKNSTYIAQWFDTRTGEYSLIDMNLKADKNGEYDIPQKPVADDMVLIVTKK